MKLYATKIPVIAAELIRKLKDGLSEFIERNGDKGWKSVEDFRGLRRDRVVVHSKIRRPEDSDYAGGYEAEGYSSHEGDGTGETRK